MLVQYCNYTVLQKSHKKSGIPNAFSNLEDNQNISLSRMN